MTPHGTTLIDAAVAKAIGLTGDVCGVQKLCHPPITVEGFAPRPPLDGLTLDNFGFWRPSSDARCAMEAAARADLWPDHYIESKLPNGNPPLIWRIVRRNSISHPMARDEIISEEPSLELAICDAVVKFMEYRKSLKNA